LFNLKENYHVAVPTAFHYDEEINVQATLEHIINLAEKRSKIYFSV